MRRHANVLIGGLIVGGLFLAAIGKGNDLKSLVALGTLLAGIGGAIGMVRSERDGILRTGWGTTWRFEDPVGFRLEAILWWALVLLWTLGGLLYGLGLIHS
jgi:hypothetical protein